jgi:phosphoribosyl 1,2-cyclic phosphodiesterase
VLIDCGLSTRQILARLDAAGLGGAQIDAVLITHEHEDHVGAARVLADRLHRRQGAPVPFFATAGTWARTRAPCLPSAREEVEAGGAVILGDLELEAFPVPHDTADPVGWRARVGDRWAGVITDLGRPTGLVAGRLRELAVAVLEFNHDEDMLMDGPYPWPVKQRVRSSHGHLSNAQGAELLEAGLHEGLEQLVLGHLSAENNRPELALAAAEGALRRAGTDHVRLHVARQDAPLAPIRIPQP